MKYKVYVVDVAHQDKALEEAESTMSCMCETQQRCMQAISTLQSHHGFELSDFRVKRISDGKVITPRAAQ